MGAAAAAFPPAFASWLSDAGVTVSPGIQAVTSSAGGGRSIVATAVIEPGDVLVAVPGRSLLAVPLARPDLAAAVDAERRRSPALTDEAVLASILLIEAAAGPASPFAPYLATIPRSFTLLATWDGAAVSALGPCPAAAAAAARAAAALEASWPPAHRLICRVLGGDSTAAGKWATKRAFAWAWCAVRSRSMHFAPPDTAGALLAVADLFNHGCAPAAGEPDHGGACLQCPGWHAEPGACPGGGRGGGGFPPLLTPPPPPPGCVAASTDAAGRCWGDGCWDPSTSTYTVTARSAYAPGDEVRLCYGPAHSNLDLLTHYGFCLPDGGNPADTATLLPSELPSSLPPPPSGGPGWSVHASGAPCWELLVALRTAAAAAVGRPSERRAAVAAAVAGRAGSPAADAAALGALARACRAAADRMSGGGGEEGGAAAAAPGSPRALAAAWRAGQVAILRRAAAAARRAAEAAADAAVRERG